VRLSRFVAKEARLEVLHDPYRDLTETVEAFLTATDARVGE
jgi:hypothetical protein